MSQKVQRILFVCLGNICRSPLAEALFQSEIESRNLGNQFKLDSCGTNGLHDGERADVRTRRNAMIHGINIPHVSRRIKLADISDFDLILTMDDSINQRVLKMCMNDEQRAKVKLFRTFDVQNPGADVPDPWFGGDEGFENVFQIIKENTDIWVNRLC